MLPKDIIAEIVSNIDTEIKYNSYVHASGTTTIDICKPTYLQAGMYVNGAYVLSANKTEVVVSGSISPPFHMQSPAFYSGTIKQQAIEFSAINVQVPFVYMIEPVSWREYSSLSLIDSELSPRLFFCTTAEFSNWTAEAYEYSIVPTYELVNAFKNTLDGMNIGNKIDLTFDLTGMTKFGVTQQNSQEVSFFRDQFAGVVCDLNNLVILKTFKCNCK